MEDDPFAGLGLRPVSLADQALFETQFALLNDPLSDYTFSQIFTWGNSLRIFWKELSGQLCVFANGTGDLTLLMPPIGNGPLDRALAEAFEVMDAYNRVHDAVGRSRVEYVSEELLGRMDHSKLLIEPMGADYVYDVRRMIDLSGGDLASKRQLRSRFLRNYDHRIEPYDLARHGEACRSLLHAWKGQQEILTPPDHSSAAIKRHKETLACELTLQSAPTLGIQGRVIYTKPRHSGLSTQDSGPTPEDWRLSGFTFGEALGQQQSSIIIEKTDLNVRGLAQFIFSEFCRTCWADRPWVNAGDDWGLKSLAWTKMSYRPVRMLHKYALRIAPRVVVAMPTVQETGNAALVVRTARKDDLPAVLGLERQCFDAFRLGRRQLQYLHHRQSAIFLVAERDGRIVGEAIGLVRQHKRGRSGRIYSLAVNPAERGKGIGRQLTEAMLEQLTARAATRIYLEVEADNLPAQKLYDQLGFRAIGHLPDYYAPGRHGIHMMRQVPASLAAPVQAEPATV